MGARGHNGRMVGVALLLGLCSCRQPNPEWLGPAPDSPGSSGTASSTGESEATTSSSGTSGPASTTAADSSGSIPDACAPEPTLGEGPCPTECTRCQEGRCEIDCTRLGCEGTSVACPEGWPCDIRCHDKDACTGAALGCGSEHDCTVDCWGQGACEGATVSCGSGPCAVSCGPQPSACNGLEVACGASDSTVTCANASDVQLSPSGSSCACEAVDCR